MLGKNFRYLALKYKLNSCISDFVLNSYNQNVFIVGCTIREFCISRGDEHWLFNMYEMEEFIEFLINIVFYVLLRCILISFLLCVFHASIIIFQVWHE